MKLFLSMATRFAVCLGAIALLVGCARAQTNLSTPVRILPNGAHTVGGELDTLDKTGVIVVNQLSEGGITVNSQAAGWTGAQVSIAGGTNSPLVTLQGTNSGVIYLNTWSPITLLATQNSINSWQLSTSNANGGSLKIYDQTGNAIDQATKTGITVTSTVTTGSITLFGGSSVPKLRALDSTYQTDIDTGLITVFKSGVVMLQSDATGSGGTVTTNNASGSAINRLNTNGVTTFSTISSGGFVKVFGGAATPEIAIYDGSVNEIIIDTGLITGFRSGNTTWQIDSFTGGVGGSIFLNTTAGSNTASLTAAKLTVPAARISSITGSTQCLQVNTSGDISGTGSTCGGGSFPSWTSYSPSFTNLSGVTVTNAFFYTNGKTTFVRLYFTGTSNGSTPSVRLPNNPQPNQVLATIIVNGGSSISGWGATISGIGTGSIAIGIYNNTAFGAGAVYSFQITGVYENL